MGQNNCKEYRTLMMGLMDDELTEDESIKLNNHMIRCESCREEYEQLKKTSSKLEGIDMKVPDEDVVEKTWRSPYSKLTKNFGIILIIFGWLTMVIYGAYEFLVTKEMESIPKFAFVIIAVGFIILFIAVLRDRIRSYRNDPYKEVEK
ncbi:MAG: zf-HC2 domain-containing protein [Acidobacteriota bacterium]